MVQGHVASGAGPEVVQVMCDNEVLLGPEIVFIS